LTTTRDHHCRRCNRSTQQRRQPPRRDDRPGLEQWRCVRCGLDLVTYRTSLGTVEDAEGLCITVINEKLGDWRASREGGQTRHDMAIGYDSVRTATAVRMQDRLDLGDAFGHLWEKLYIAWADFDPDRGVAFRSYAVHQLRCRLIDWIRTQRGRDGQKAQANAAAISDLWHRGGRSADAHSDDTRLALEGITDAGRLEHALNGSALDDPVHSLADLRRTLAARRDDLASFDPTRSHSGDSP